MTVGRTLVGVAASPGIAVGAAWILDDGDLSVPERSVPPGERDAEVDRFRRAIEEVEAELERIRGRMSESLGEDHGKVLEAHLTILHDTLLVDDTLAGIRDEGRNAEAVFDGVVGRILEAFDSIEDEYLRERAADVRDVRRRILRRLLGRRRAHVTDLTEPKVVVTHDLAFTDTAEMSKARVLGIVSDRGGRTSHAAIAARHLEIPAVVGLGGAAVTIPPGELVIVDGNRGIVVLAPDAAVERRYLREIEFQRAASARQEKLRDLPCVTQDGREVALLANIDAPKEAERALRQGARGVGLFRSESLWVPGTRGPSEEEQAVAYSGVVRALFPHPVTIRTFDLGADKVVADEDAPAELNPFLGWRGIRFSLGAPDLFLAQTRAVLRAGAHGRVQLLLPMVSGVEEVRAARELFQRAAASLDAEGIARGQDVPLGIMVETPAAAMLAPELALESDFFSIGSNDLVQYTLAVDRGNERIAALYEPLHPAVLRLIREVVWAGHERGISVGVCGEMAAEPAATALLVGLGVDLLSVAPLSLPEVKEVVRSLSWSAAKEAAERALACATAQEVRALVREAFGGLVGGEDPLGAHPRTGGGRRWA